MDKTKLLNLLNTKKSTFDSLHKKMEKIIPTLESGKTAYAYKPNRNLLEDPVTIQYLYNTLFFTFPLRLY